MRDQKKKIPQTKVATYFEQRDRQRKGNSKRTKRPQKRIQRPFCGMTLFAGTTFFVFVVQRSNLCRSNKRSVHKARSKEALVTFEALEKLELRPQILRSNILGQRTVPKGCYEMCRTWKYRREEEVQLNCGNMRLGPNLSRKSQPARTFTN